MKTKILTILALLLMTVTQGAWAENYLYLEVSGTSATLKYGDKGSNPYHIDRGWSSNDFTSTVTTITVDASCNSHSETSFKYLFYNCTKLTTINGLGNLKTAGVTDMSDMFYYDEALTTLDLSTWNTASVTDMSSMFNGCSKLATIYVGGGWSTANVTSSTQMFYNCSKLPNYNSSVVDKTKAHTGDGGYLTAPGPGTAVDLGLPSGKKWADRNVGALNETGYGTYYAWSSSDIATAQWGTNWRMPTLTEAQELINNTDQEWATIGGVNGMKYMKKTDHSVYIFLPAAGWNANTNVGTKGTYWTSTTLEADDSKAYELFLDASNTTTGNDRKNYQFSVRPVQMFAGEGTEDSPYLIASTTDWNNLVSAVNAGETYSGTYFKMTANVGTVSTWMTGTFSGTFDGDGNTLTVDFDGSVDLLSPFGKLGGATIQNLIVAGTIKTSNRRAAAISGWVNESTTNSITNCRVTATISSSYSGDVAIGGFLGRVDGNVTLTGCAFTGKLLTTNGSNDCGGFVGFKSDKSSTLTLTNCLYAPASTTGSETWIGSVSGVDGSATFGRHGNNTAPTLDNCYYTQTMGTDYARQTGSLQAFRLEKGNGVTTLAMSGSGTEYTVSGITVYSGGIDFNDGSTTTFYGGSGQEVSLALTAETRDGYQFKQYAASQGTLSGQTTDTPTLTMPAANSTANDVVTISAEYDPTYNATFAQNIDDAEHWTISPTKTTAGSTVSLAYTGTTHRVNSVTVMKEGEATETFETTKEVNNYAGTNVSIYAEHEGDENGFNVHSDFATTISTTNGKNITSVVLTTGSGSVTPSNVTASPGTCTVSGNIITITDINATSVSISSNKWGYIKVSQVDVTYPGLVPDNDVTVAWNGAENTGTFTMPAYDVVVSADMEIPTYNVTFADGNDNDDWMIDPEQQIEGGTVTVSYTGENKVKSVTVKANPSTLAGLKAAINDASDLTDLNTKVLGKYVTATGDIQSTSEGAVGIIAYISKTAVDNSFADSRIFVIATENASNSATQAPSNAPETTYNSTSDLNGYAVTNAWQAADGYNASKEGWNYSASRPDGASHWFVPSYGQWMLGGWNDGNNRPCRLMRSTMQGSGQYYAVSTAINTEGNDTGYCVDGSWWGMGTIQRIQAIRVRAAFVY